MRTEEGEEIVDPGDYDLGDGQRLRVYILEDDDEQVTMWACTHCQEVDGTTNALLVNVIDGTMTLQQDDTGEFSLGLTSAGIDRAKNLIERLGGSKPEDDHS